MKKGPLFLVMFGLPGSGKSYFAERLAKDLGLVHLRSDKIRKRLFPKPTYLPGEQKQLFSFMDLLAETAIARGHGVIYDANSTKRVFRMRLQRIAKKYNARYATVRIQTPLETAIKRARAREFHPIDADVVKGIGREMELPKREPVVIVDGTKPYKLQRNLVAERLRTI